MGKVYEFHNMVRYFIVISFHKGGFFSINFVYKQNNQHSWTLNVNYIEPLNATVLYANFMTIKLAFNFMIVIQKRD